MTTRTGRLVTAFAAALAIGTAGCAESTGPGMTEGTATVSFRAASAGATASGAIPAVALSHSGDPDAPTLTVEGSNGNLTIASVHFIVEEFELERTGATGTDACESEDSAASSPDHPDDGATDHGAEDDGSEDEGSAEEDDEEEDEGDDDACEEFEAPMQFLELPLTGENAVAVRQDVPVGEYGSLEFSIEDLEDDEEDDEAGAIQELLTEVRSQYPDWPRRASLRLHGTFTPRDEAGSLLSGEARDFTVYFQAEVEIEKEFDSPVEVTEDQKSITVVVDPTPWFSATDGRVVDLSGYDFDPEAGGPVPELEVEIEGTADEGFAEIEIGD